MSPNPYACLSVVTTIGVVFRVGGGVRLNVLKKDNLIFDSSNLRYFFEPKSNTKELDEQSNLLK